MQVFFIVNLNEEFASNPIKKTFNTFTLALTFLGKVIGDKKPMRSQHMQDPKASIASMDPMPRLH
jgi:hypothetical protein